MKIAIFGAGSTGCYIGGMLACAGCQVTLVCRERIKEEITAAKGLRLTDYAGFETKVLPNRLITEVQDETFDLVIVTLKCHHLKSAIEDLRKLSNQGATLVFMQNGLNSLNQIEKDLKNAKIIQGITPFNVLHKGKAHFHRGTEGDLIFQECKLTIELRNLLENANIGCDLYKDMRPVICGKLMLNLNNAINALIDLPLKTELEDRRFRLVLSQAMQEWLSICDHQGVKPAQYTAVAPKLVPRLLKLPNFLFLILAKKMLAIDPEARSSMWEDIQAGRKTEIEFLNGAVADLAEELGIEAPVNRHIASLIQRREQGQTIKAEELLTIIA